MLSIFRHKLLVKNGLLKTILDPTPLLLITPQHPHKEITYDCRLEAKLKMSSSDKNFVVEVFGKLIQNTMCRKANHLPALCSISMLYGDFLPYHLSAEMDFVSQNTQHAKKI